MCLWPNLFTKNHQLNVILFLFLTTQFIPWKKLYHRYLMNEEQAVSKVDGILLNCGIEKESDLCVLNLIR
jgi:hypothetical protein